MSRPYVCIGEYAKNPYYFDKIYTNIYSIEELCFALYENAFLLDNTIVNKKLVEWIELECKLTDLARELYPLVTHGGNVEAFAGMILSYTGYYNEEGIDKVSNILRMNIAMNTYEKWKAKADFMLENGHCVMAIREYAHLVEEAPESEILIRSQAFNNMGVAYMRLFLYKPAMAVFEAAYRLDGNVTAYRHMLTIKKLTESEAGYEKYVSDNPELTKLSENIESRMEMAQLRYKESAETARLSSLSQHRNNKDTSVYYDEIANIAGQLKEGYRDSVMDGTRSE